MKNTFYRIFRLKPDESKLVFALGAILFVNYTAMGITKVVSVSGFLSQVKDHYILLVWAVDMVLLILATGLQSLIIDRYNRVALLGGVLLVFTGLYALLPFSFLSATFPKSISYTLLYLLNDQQWRFFPVVFWILVNDIFSPAQGRRLLPVIANFAFIGTIIGLGVGALDARIQIGPVKLLYFNAGIFLIAFIISRTSLKKVRISTSSRASVAMKEVFSEGWEFITTIPAYAYLAAGMLSTGIIMTILLYDVLSEAKFDLGNGFQAFYAQYSLMIAFGSLLVQSFANWIIERVSLKNSFLIQPLTMLSAALANFFIPGYFSSAAAQGAARVSYETIDQSSRKALQAFVPNEKRGRVSMFIDSYLPSFGTIIGSMLTFGIITAGIKYSYDRPNYTAVYMVVAVLVAILAIISINMMRKTYDVSMLNWQLKRRTRGASMLDGLDFAEGGAGKADPANPEGAAPPEKKRISYRSTLLKDLDLPDKDKE